MENFLKKCGLSHAISAFNEHQVSLHQLRELINQNEMLKELLPGVGDRLKLIQAVKEMDSERQANEPSKNKRKLESEHNLSKKAVSKEGPCKRQTLLKILTEHHRVAHLYRLATTILLEFSLFSLENGMINCKKQMNWKLIDIGEGNLHCAICNLPIAIQIRRDSTLSFNIANYKRHYVVEHGLTRKSQEVEPGDIQEDHSLALDMNVTNVDDKPMDIDQSCSERLVATEVDESAAFAPTADNVPEIVEQSELLCGGMGVTVLNERDHGNDKDVSTGIEIDAESGNP